MKVKISPERRCELNYGLWQRKHILEKKFEEKRKFTALQHHWKRRPQPNTIYSTLLHHHFVIPLSVTVESSQAGRLLPPNPALIPVLSVGRPSPARLRPGSRPG